MASFANIDGNFKQRYGRWIEPLPDDHTLADYGDFIPQEQRPGYGYNFPVLTAWEHGQTSSTDGSAFTLNPAIDSRVLNANLDGSTILIQSVVSYDVIFQSLNGTGNGNTGGAYKTALDQAVQAMLLGGGLYRELALAYGPGTNTALAANIGVVSSVISGANLGAGQVLAITALTWIPGLWVVAQNMKVDIYAADGTTLRDSGITVTDVNTALLSRITVQKVGSVVTTVAANDQITPFGWRLTSAFGVEAIYNNATTLFNINAATVAPWRCRVFATTGTLSRSKIAGYAANIALNGTKNGGKLFVSGPTFADLAIELDAFQRWIGNGAGAKKTGTSTIEYDTSAGVIEVVVYQYAKQGQAMFIAADNFRRVGSTDLTMRPIGGGSEGFFTHLTDKSGAQMKVFSNQAPVFEMPYRNFLVTGIVNSTGATP